MGQFRLIALLELLAAARAVIHGQRRFGEKGADALDHAGEARRESQHIVRG